MLKGECTGLRAVEREDLPLLRDWRNMETMRRFFRESGELNMTDQERWFDAVCHSGSRHRMFAITSVDDGGTVVGVCGLTNINWVARSAEISLYIGKDAAYVDSLLAPDALDVLIRYGFNELNLHKLWAETYAFDKRKSELLIHFSFVCDGVLRDTVFCGGEYADSHIYSLLQPDWRHDTTHGKGITE